MKRIISMLLALTLILSSFSLAFADDVTLSDVPAGSWYYDDVTSLVKVGGINGYPDGTFKPQATITAAEFIKITVGIYADFLNVRELSEGDKWYSPYVEAAIENGIVIEGMFTDYNEPITREKMSVIMELASEKILKEDTLTDSEKIAYLKNKFYDYKDVCDYCKDYVVQAAARGIIGGYPDGTFKPQGNATRAEAATMLVRLSYSPRRLAVTYGERTQITAASAYENGYFGNDYSSYFWESTYGKYPIYFIEDREEAIATLGLIKAENKTNSDGDYCVVWHRGTLLYVKNSGEYSEAHSNTAGSTPAIDFITGHIENVKYFIMVDDYTDRANHNYVVYICENPFI